MKNKTYTLTKNLLNVILPIFNYKYSEDSLNIIKKVMKTYLTVWDATEYYDKILRIVLDTFILQGKEDCLMLEDFDTSKYTTHKKYFFLKKRILEDNGIDASQSFDTELFLDCLNDYVKNGEKHACRMKAYMAWDNGEKRLATRLWEMLAYWGDETSMMALVFAYKQYNMISEAQTWQAVFDLFSDDTCGVMPIDDKIERMSYQEKNIVDLIFCIKNLAWIKDKSFLHFPMLDYIISSNERGVFPS